MAIKAGVTGVLHGLRQSLGAVALPLRTVDDVSADLHRTGTGEGVALRNHALLQSRRQHQGLKGGAGLVGLLDGAVAPLGLPGGRGGLGLGLVLQLLVGELLVGGLLVVFCLQLLVDDGVSAAMSA